MPIDIPIGEGGSDDAKEGPTAPVSGDEKKIPGDEKKVPGDEKKVPGDEKKVPGDEKKVPVSSPTSTVVPPVTQSPSARTTPGSPGMEKNVPGSEKNVPGSENKVPGSEKKVPGSDKETSEDFAGISQMVYSTSGIFIAILVISLLIYIYRMGGNLCRSGEQQYSALSTSEAAAIDTDRKSGSSNIEMGGLR